MIYKDSRIIDTKPKWVIVDEDGKIINRNPTKEELKCLKIFKNDGRSNPKRKIPYNDTNTCDRCGNKLVLDNIKKIHHLDRKMVM